MNCIGPTHDRTAPQPHINGAARPLRLIMIALDPCLCRDRCCCVHFSLFASIFFLSEFDSRICNIDTAEGSIPMYFVYSLWAPCTEQPAARFPIEYDMNAYMCVPQRALGHFENSIEVVLMKKERATWSDVMRVMEWVRITLVHSCLTTKQSVRSMP